ncbi:MAG: VCBS repeat-containing protein, partial [Saprospiraceae bacterium]|nr:VCBS repeat-containing protein [Saprospiraceae bacterium]
YKNQGDLRFTDQSDIWGIDFEGFSTGAAYADLDNDGDLDIVLNNLDDVASIYENLAETKKTNNYLLVSLEGQFDNHFGLGAKIVVHTGNQVQYQYLQTTRGFQSAVPPEAHFGLGDNSQVDKIEVHWPNGSISKMEDLPSNQHIVITQKNAVTADKTVEEQKLFIEISSGDGIEFMHEEIPYDDFASEVLLPHKYSQLGPAIAVGDVNGDQLDDLYIGGAAEQSGALFMQTQEGRFRQASQSTWNQDKNYEDVDAIFFDADGDQDVDLYVVSGSNEWQPGNNQYMDRLYLNQGRGQFEKSDQAIPPIATSGSCVRPSDFDGDGDLDLFIGGRIIPGAYPLPANSFFLENNNGKFTDVTSKVFGMSFKPGLVTDAQWLDFDNDQDEDLAIVGEWMPISIMQNTSGKFELLDNVGLENSSGWWYSLAAKDLDQDGDIDLIAGNLGLNYKYEASTIEPFQVYASDFDENGNLDIVLGYFNDGELFPLRGRQCSSEQIPSLIDKFQNYSQFASASLVDVYGKRALEKALHLEAHTFASSIIENLGDGTFSIDELPLEAQLSSVNEIVIDDINDDQHPDLILAGNMFGSEVETARNDASIGLVLLGKGDGNFTPMTAIQSGFMAPEDVKALAKITGINKQTTIIAGNNNDKIRAWKINVPLQK